MDSQVADAGVIVQSGGYVELLLFGAGPDLTVPEGKGVSLRFCREAGCTERMGRILLLGDGWRRVQHGSNPEHSVIVREGGSISDWLDAIHRYEEAVCPT